MSEWETRQLDELVTIRKGKLVAQRDYKRLGDLPIVTAGSITNEYKLFGNPDGAVTCKANDVLMLWDGERSGLVTQGHNGIVGSTFALLSTRVPLDQTFLFYQLQRHFSWIQNRRTGTGVPHVPKDLGRILSIPCPTSLNAQRKIARILSTVDAVIEQTEQTVAKYKSIKAGMLQDLFTRGLDANGVLRPHQAVSPHLYKQSELGWIPVEWNVDKLETLINAVDPQPDHRTPTQVENGIPYLGINDIDEQGKIDYRKCRKVSRQILEEHNRRYQIQKGDIIFGKIGSIGEPKQLYRFNELTLSANLILLQPKQNPDYVFWSLNFEVVVQQINSSLHTTSQPAFGMEKIRSLLVPVCSSTEQRLISSKLNALQSNIRTETAYLEKLQKLKAGLMNDLLSGAKPVVVEEETAASV